jgi:hypothetical protein
MDAIDRIRDFALAPADRDRSLAQGVPSLATSFHRSRKHPGRKRLRRVAATPRRDEPSEEEMCRLVRPYGFVVRIDATALIEDRPFLKLYRFADRCHPAGTFAGFSELMQWLTEQTPNRS